MKKKFKYYDEIKHILIVLGIIFIWVGAVIAFSNNTKNEETPDTVKKIIVNTEIKTGDKINNEQYEVHKIGKKYEEYYFRNRNINLKNQYLILYPNKLTKKNISDANLIISNGYININGLCSQSKSFEEYEEKIISKYENQEDIKYNVSIANEINKINGINVKYLKIETLEKSILDDGTTQDFYSEKFIVLLKESDTSICEISYLIYEQKFTDEMLTDFINNIKVKKNKANFLYTNIKNNNIEGTLTQRDLRNLNKKYMISYNIPSKNYKEIESDQNDIYSHTFTQKNTNLKVNVSLETILSTEKFIEDYMEYLKEEINIKKNLSVKEIVYNINIYNNREYYEIDLLYFDNIDNLNITSKYFITKLEENIYYIIKIENITGAYDISEFFSFEFKKISS